MSAVSRRNFISEMRDVYFTVSDLVSRDNEPGYILPGDYYLERPIILDRCLNTFVNHFRKGTETIGFCPFFMPLCYLEQWNNRLIC